MDCPRCGEALLGQFQFCPFCGTALRSTDASLKEARKVVSVLFCDVVGSTAGAVGLDPEDVSEVLRTYHRAARSIVEQHGGVVEKFVGDGLFAVFGVPVVHEDDAERAVRAALTICDAAPRMPGLGEDRLHVRCGITTGELLVRVGVDATSGEGFVTGTAANVAGRLQGLAPVDGVVVDSQTFRLTRDAFAYAELAPAKVKGISDPLELFVAQAALVPVRGRRAEQAVPLVGRATELSALAAARDEVVAAACSAVLTISGEPGLGKSRLVSALEEHVFERAPSTVWRVGHCLPYGDGAGLWPIAEILRGEAEILESDDAATMLEKLDIALPRDLYPNWVRRRLLSILGLGPSSSADHAELVAACRHFISLIARQRPAVIVFEDVHWADNAVLAVLAELVRHPADVPLLTVATARPELLERDGASVAALRQRVVHLDPLADADVASLAASLLGGTAMSRSSRR